MLGNCDAALLGTSDALGIRLGKTPWLVGSMLLDGSSLGALLPVTDAVLGVVEMLGVVLVSVCEGLPEKTDEVGTELRVGVMDGILL